MDVMVASATAVGLLIFVTWIISLLIHDASIIDIMWGFGFVVVAVVSAVVGDGSELRRYVFVAIVGVWGLRLTTYLAIRNLGNGEDFRYAKMRRRWGDQFAMVSLVQVYLVQGILMLIVSLPIQLSAGSLQSTRGPLSIIGLALWLVGVAFESIGDFQLARFKGNDDNAGLVMDKGLWRYTRHPNYFGDFCVWWGIGLIAVETHYGLWGLFGPAVMTILLLRVSGVRMLESTIGERRPGYADYVARTSAFFPRPPKRGPVASSDAD
jgi:steroid 5-alpha reductase family enzyme